MFYLLSKPIIAICFMATPNAELALNKAKHGPVNIKVSPALHKNIIMAKKPKIAFIQAINNTHVKISLQPNPNAPFDTWLTIAENRCNPLVKGGQ